MTAEVPTLGELEIRVLRTVWEHQPCTERQVSDLVRQDRPVGRTTVLRAMQRMEAKGLLVRQPGDGPVRFRARMGEKRVLSRLIGRFIERTLGGSPGALAAYLADSQDLSARDVKALRAIARRLGDRDEGRKEGTSR